MSLTLEDLASNSNHCCCAYGRVVVTRSQCAPDASYLRDWVNVLLRYGKSHPLGLGVVVIIDANAQPPTEAERGAIRTAYVNVKSVVRGCVQVVEGQGFIAAAMRGALTLTNMTAGLGFPIKVVGEVAEAAPLLAKMLADPRVDAAHLLRAATEIRARLTR